MILFYLSWINLPSLLWTKRDIIRHSQFVHQFLLKCEKVDVISKLRDLGIQFEEGISAAEAKDLLRNRINDNV